MYLFQRFFLDVNIPEKKTKCSESNFWSNVYLEWHYFFPGSIRLPANINLYDDLEDEDLLALDEYIEYDDLEDNLGESARYLRQSAGPSTHYVQVTYGSSGLLYLLLIHTSFSTNHWPQAKMRTTSDTIF